MEYKELRNKLTDLNNEYRRNVHYMILKFAKDKEVYKVGDIIEHKYNYFKIKITNIEYNITATINNPTYSTVYIGNVIKKDGKVGKKIETIHDHLVKQPIYDINC